MISELREQRAAIDKRITQEEHAQAMTAWEQAKTQAREAKKNVGKMRQAFNKAASDWSNYERECEQVRLSLEQHLAQRPADDDLPTAAEIRDWENKRDRLHRLLTVSMRARRLDLANIMEAARVELLKADALFVELAYAERNARTKALGLPASELHRVAL